MSSLRSVKAEENHATGIGSPSSPPSSSSPHTGSSSANAAASSAPRMTTGTTLLRPSSRIIKKGDGGESSSNPPAAGPTPRSPSPPPPTTYRDIPLLSVSSATPWVHHLARFVHHQRIDPTDPAQFVAPLKLNRKQPPKPRQTWPKAGDTLVDRYGRPVRLASGRELTWPKQGEDTSEHRKILERLAPQSAQQGKDKAHANGYDASLVAPGAASAARASNRPLFQKRVRQIHKASATARRIHNDESVPWVLEDFETGNHWESSRTPRKDSVHALARHFLDGGEGLVGGAQEGEEQEDSKKKIKKEAAEHRLTQHAPWIGKLEGGDVALASGSKRSSTANGSSSSSSDASAQVLFVFDERNQGGFKVIPLRKTYRFMQKSRFADERGDEEREKEFERLQKSRAIGATDRFAGRADRGGAVSVRGGGGGGYGGGGGGGISGLVMPGTGGSRGSSGGVKKEESLEDDWPQLRGLSLGSYVPSRPRGLVAVSGGSSRSRRGMDDDDVHGGMGGGDDGGTYDEVEYHEDFADDEERMGGEAELVEDADEREREERLRREMVKAGIGEGMGGDGVKEEEDEDEDLFGSGSGSTSAQQQQQPRGRRRDDQLTGSGRQMKKIMRALARREGQDVDGLYDSDEDDDVDLFDVDGARGRRGRGGANPYADDEGMGSDEDEEEPALANPEEAIRRAMEEKREREAREAKEGVASGAASGAASGSERTSRGSTPTPGSAQQQQQGARTPTQTGRGGQQASSSGRTTPSKRPRERDPSSSSQGVRPPPGSRPSHQQQGKGHHDSAKRAASSSRPLSRPVSPSAAVSRSPSPGPSQQGQGQMHAPRQSSPLAHPSSTMTEGQAAAAAAAAGTKRPASPQPSNHAASSSSRPASPTSSKRPRTDSVSSSSSQPSTRRSTPNPATTSLERELINLVRSGQVKSIAEVIAAFKKRLQARPELKGEMMGAFKRCLTGGTKGEPLRVKEGL